LGQKYLFLKTCLGGKGGGGERKETKTRGLGGAPYEENKPLNLWSGPERRGRKKDTIHSITTH